MSKKSEPQAFYVLDADKLWARNRIAELQKAIQDLGPEFNIALTQSNETWHDNAPFDALRDTQAVLVAEMQNLKQVLFKAAISVPKPKKAKVSIGSRVSVTHKGRNQMYLLTGHWSPSVGKKQDGALVVSCGSPVGSVLFGAKVGDQVIIPTNHHSLDIIAID